MCEPLLTLLRLECSRKITLGGESLFFTEIAHGLKRSIKSLIMINHSRYIEAQLLKPINILRVK